MPVDHTTSLQPPASASLAGAGGQGASWAPKTADSATGVAADHARDSCTRQLIPNTGLSDAPIHAALRSALESDWAKKFINISLVSRSLDGFMTPAEACDALSWLADELTQSAAAGAAFSQRCLGFADQLDGSFGYHSRRADHYVERTARRRAHRRTDATATETAVGGR